MITLNDPSTHDNQAQKKTAPLDVDGLAGRLGVGRLRVAGGAAARVPGQTNPAAGVGSTCRTRTLYSICARF